MSETQNEVLVVNSTSLITNMQNQTMIERANSLKDFKEFVKNDMVDGIDFGQIPGTDKPTLLKPGMEKIQFYLGLTPQYKLLNRQFIPNQNLKSKEYNEVTKKYDEKEVVRNYYAWEWSCELWHGNTKVAEGVGCGNTEERKYTSQYKGSETPDSLANTVMKIAKKRALADAILQVGGISDLYTVDLEDNATIQKLKVNKKEDNKKLSKDNIKTIYATVGALGLIDKDLNEIINELGYSKIQDIPSDQCNKVIEEIKKLAKLRKGEN